MGLLYLCYTIQCKRHTIQLPCGTPQYINTANHLELTFLYSTFSSQHFVSVTHSKVLLSSTNPVPTHPHPLNHLMPNGHISGRTAPLTYRCYIFFIYSTNIHTEYFKHAAHTPFFPLQNVVFFIMLTFLFRYYSHFIYRMC
jgi:hypothetical protein